MSLTGRPWFQASVAGTVVQVTGHPTTIAHGTIYNTTAATAFLQIFNKLAADVTPGTTVPDFVISASPGDNDPILGGLLLMDALSVACTTTPTGNTAAACHISLSLC